MMRSIYRYGKGWVSALIAYPLAEYIEKREIRGKKSTLLELYKNTFEKRKMMMQCKLIDTLKFAGTSVPYYKDLFKIHKFNPENIKKDISYFLDLPYLTKDIIREQGRRMLSDDLSVIRHYPRKTGGSTGPSTQIYYDKEGIDHAAAVTLYAREMIGKKKHNFEMHFAAQFSDHQPIKISDREYWKEIAMNRKTIFSNRLDEYGLQEMLEKLISFRPYLLHGHPSTIYALGCYVKEKYGKLAVFQVFESSGELLQDYQRTLIVEVFQCRVVNRYGLAEFGVIAYELNNGDNRLKILDSEGWPESSNFDDQSDGANHELIFTGFRNKLMPLVRYKTGDLAQVVEEKDGFYLNNVFGRIHDIVYIRGVPVLTHYIMDVLDHRIGGIREFQIDLRNNMPLLRVALEENVSENVVRDKISAYWENDFQIEFVSIDQFIRVGRHQKFRHLVQ